MYSSDDLCPADQHSEHIHTQHVYIEIIFSSYDTAISNLLQTMRNAAETAVGVLSLGLWSNLRSIEMQDGY
jgi:hypothetical protein